MKYYNCIIYNIIIAILVVYYDKFDHINIMFY